MSTIHEMRNQLTVAVANIEAFIDGKLEPTTDRLGAVLNALEKLNALMHELRPAAHASATAPTVESIDAGAPIASETNAIEAAAASAGIALGVATARASISNLKSPAIGAGTSVA